MKKIFSILLALSLVFGLAACTNSGDNKPAPGSDPVKEPDPVVEPEPTDVYMAFLREESDVTMNFDAYGMQEGKSYGLKEFVENVNEKLNDEYGEGFMGDVSYTFLDCGLDGIPEMALNVQHFMNRGDYTEELTAFFVIRAYGTLGLKVVDHDYTYYRYTSTLNQAGFIWAGGSSGANYWGYNVRFVNANGGPTYLYSCDEIYALDGTFIPTYMLPSDRDSAPFEYIEEYKEDGNTLTIYNFEQYGTWELNTYNQHLWKNYYVFTDFYGEDVELDPEYKAYFDQIGLNVVDSGTMDSIVEDYLRDLGVTDEMVDADPVEWIKWDADWMPKG
jgi:hypothetical protein